MFCAAPAAPTNCIMQWRAPSSPLENKPECSAHSLIFASCSACLSLPNSSSASDSCLNTALAGQESELRPATARRSDVRSWVVMHPCGKGQGSEALGQAWWGGWGAQV